jgi:hypothetical protein
MRIGADAKVGANCLKVNGRFHLCPHLFEPVPAGQRESIAKMNLFTITRNNLQSRAGYSQCGRVGARIERGVSKRRGTPPCSIGAVLASHPNRAAIFVADPTMTKEDCAPGKQQTLQVNLPEALGRARRWQELSSRKDARPGHRDDARQGAPHGDGSTRINPAPRFALRYICARRSNGLDMIRGSAIMERDFTEWPLCDSEAASVLL